MSAPKKSLGQHWLFDEASLNAMLAAGEITPQDVVLEVGPGLGTLTAKLCAQAKEVIAVELDDTLAAELKGNALRHLERSKAQPKDLASNTDQILRQAQDDWLCQPLFYNQKRADAAR